MKLEIQDGSKAVEKLGIHVRNFDGEIAENSSYINLTYRVEDLERELSKHIKKLNICLLLIAYACLVIGIAFMGVFTFRYFTMTVGKKLGYEAQRKTYSIQRSFISGADMILYQMRDGDEDALRVETEDESPNATTGEEEQEDDDDFVPMIE